MESRDLELIRFVTRRQAELRGLHTTAFGLWMTGLLAATYYAPMRRGGSVHLAVLMVVIALPNMLHDVAARWYAAQIGRVGQVRKFFRPRLQSAMVFAAMMLDLLGVTPVAGRSAVLLLLAGYSLWVAVRDFPYRAYHLIALVLVAAGPEVTDLAAKSNEFYPQYALAGLWFIVAGLADHCLLVMCIKRTAGRAYESAEVFRRTAR